MRRELSDVSLVYLSISDVMQILGLEKDYIIRRDIQKGILKARKTGIRYLIHYKDMLEYRSWFKKTQKKQSGYLTVKKVAEILDVSIKYVRNAIKKKELEAVKEGRCYLIAPDNVENFFLNSQVNSKR